MRSTVLWLVFVALVASGCDGSTHNQFHVQQASCNVTPAGAAVHAECHEWEILHSGDVAVFKRECDVLNAPSVQTSAYNDATGCDRTGSVGGCQASGSPVITVWYYAPYQWDTVTAICQATPVMP